MSKANQQQDVSVLSAAKNGLVYLTPNDWALIADKAVRRQFKAGELIVQQGRRTHGVYLLVRGTALVRFRHRERRSESVRARLAGRFPFSTNCLPLRMWW